MSTPTANKQLVIDFCDALFVPGGAEAAVGKYLSPNYIQHNPYAADGPDALAAFVNSALARNPQTRYELQRSAAEGDLVFVHWRMTTGPADRGTAVTEIFRIDGDRIVEHWDVMQAMPEQTVSEHPLF
ncbi:nuclear transport factor 2 family protein [Nocardia yamanashiensis]|uniref:nuclear transport factor 2 family protein n=1 Tax=Nocardia yamanashiensis TaxID=209247 RepID=UPI001E2D29B9|nr:nuclear transport factor 2 family protein [Nocardia yamanashiensis]UGT39818.1 nuclear transport factor 2 family protein [Nocardia yamanashiensis]